MSYSHEKYVEDRREKENQLASWIVIHLRGDMELNPDQDAIIEHLINDFEAMWFVYEMDIIDETLTNVDSGWIGAKKKRCPPGIRRGIEEILPSELREKIQKCARSMFAESLLARSDKETASPKKKSLKNVLTRKIK